MKEVVPDLLVSLFVKVWNEHNSTWLVASRPMINFGWCYQFAMLMRKLHGPTAKLYCSSGHAWVKIGNKHYDTDHPEGQDSAIITPYDTMLHEDMDEEAFTKLWSRSDSGGIQFNVIDQVISLYRGAVG